MPHSVRHWAREELDRASKQIDWVGTHVVRVAQRYEEKHPEISDPLYAVAKILVELQKGIDTTRQKI